MTTTIEQAKMAQKVRDRRRSFKRIRETILSFEILVRRSVAKLNRIKETPNQTIPTFPMNLTPLNS